MRRNLILFGMMGLSLLFGSTTAGGDDVVPPAVPGYDAKEVRKTIDNAMKDYIDDTKKLLEVIANGQNIQSPEQASQLLEAITALGYYHDPRAVRPMIDLMNIRNTKDPATLYDFARDVDNTVFCALVNIGKPASIESVNYLKSISVNDKDEVTKYKSFLLLQVIRFVEGNEVAPFMLERAIDKEQDKDKKANLTAALELLNKWIKADEDRAKQQENPTTPPAEGTTPPADNGTAPPAGGNTNPPASGAQQP